jgi:hypothetical protein
MNANCRCAGRFGSLCHFARRFQFGAWASTDFKSYRDSDGSYYRRDDLLDSLRMGHKCPTFTPADQSAYRAFKVQVNDVKPKLRNDFGCRCHSRRIASADLPSPGSF